MVIDLLLFLAKYGEFSGCCLQGEFDFFDAPCISRKIYVFLRKLYKWQCLENNSQKIQFYNLHKCKKVKYSSLEKGHHIQMMWEKKAGEISY